VCADIERLPFRDDTVSAVVCLRFFAHLPRAQWKMVLRRFACMTSGPIVVGLPMRWSSKHWWRAFKRQLGINAKQRPIFRREALTDVLAQANLELCGRVWQSPFTDTALLVARRRRAAGEGRPAAVYGEPVSSCGERASGERAVSPDAPGSMADKTEQEGGAP
jgi:hypothetical protein